MINRSLPLSILIGSKKSVLFCSILACVLPLQEVALRQSPSTLSVLCCLWSHCFLLPHNVISPVMFWSYKWSYALFLLPCAAKSLSVVFDLGNVSSPFPFCIGYILDYVCHWFFAYWCCYWCCLLALHLAFSFPWLTGLFKVSLLML